MESTASEESCPPWGRRRLSIVSPQHGASVVWGKRHGRAPSHQQAGLPVDGIVHDEHFVLIPGPFFFLQQKKLKMSTSDAALEIKNRADAVQGRTREALVASLLLLHCKPLPRASSCWGWRCPTPPPTRHPEPLLRPRQDWLCHPAGTQLIHGSSPAHPSLSQTTRVSQKFKDPAGPCTTRGGLSLLRHRCCRDRGCLPSSSSSE